MKLTLKQYTEPLTIEVERNGEIVDTIDFELDFCDRNVFRMIDMARDVIKSVKDFDANAGTKEIIKTANAAIEKIEPMIDMLAGEGATKRIAEAFGKAYEPEDVLRGIIDVWDSLNEECMARSTKSRVTAAERYLDAEA